MTCVINHIQCPGYSYNPAKQSWDKNKSKLGMKQKSKSTTDIYVFDLFKAWRLWIEDKATELIDKSLGNKCTLSDQVLRCIHVGLLCVQQRPEDRPDMSSVVLMLSSESLLPKPRQPGFYMEKALPEADSSSTKLEPCSTNEISITMLMGR